MSKSNVPSTVSSKNLAAMAYVARMKEAADKLGCGFVGGFISPEGEKFVMTNMNEEETNLLIPDHLRDDSDEDWLITKY